MRDSCRRKDGLPVLDAADVPEFEFSQQFQLKISDLVTKGLRVETTVELRRASGCNLKNSEVVGRP